MLVVMLPVVLLIIAVILLPVVAAFADEKLSNAVVHGQDSDDPPDSAGEDTLLAA